MGCGCPSVAKVRLLLQKAWHGLVVGRYVHRLVGAAAVQARAGWGQWVGSVGPPERQRGEVKRRALLKSGFRRNGFLASANPNRSLVVGVPPNHG